MSDLKYSDELLPKIHPGPKNFGPDTAYDFDQEPWFRLQAEFHAEREGVSVDAAKAAIKGGHADQGEWLKPRERNIPLSNTVAESEGEG